MTELTFDYDWARDLAQVRERLTTPTTAPDPQPEPRPAAAGLDLAPQQVEAVNRVHDWYQAEQQVFRLFGYAGTGKTTIARHIVDTLGVNALFAAYTGKAAYVLRTKGAEDASTIHSLIYQPVEKTRAKLHDLRRRLADETDPTERDILARQIKVETDKLADPDFILREESPLDGAPLLVLDEVSMVGQQVASDLLSYGVKLLVLGDPAQLPPVDGGGYFINATPDALLTDIHRSALDSPVTRLATDVRNSPTGDRTHGLSTIGDCGLVDRIPFDQLGDIDQVLVGTNKTRWTVIHLLRALRGVTSPTPVEGDRIMALANSREADVFNGQQFRVLTDAVPVPRRDDQLRMTVVDADAGGQPREITCWAGGFAGFEGEKDAKRQGRGNVAAATFADAITVHKAQGSQWPRVLVIDESGVFARATARDGGTAEQAHLAGQRWLYTAVTRAANQVRITTPRGLLG